jgi:hypothetical protein
MSLSFRFAPILALLAGVAGCGASTSRSTPLPKGVVEAEQARQRELALTDVEHHQGRLDSIAYPLLARSTSLCPAAVAYRLGMRVATVHEYEEPWREAAASVFRLSDTLTVLGLVREGPAGDAGLRKGDRLLRVNGSDLPTGSEAARAFGSTVAAVRETGGNQISIAYRRARGKRGDGRSGARLRLLAPTSWWAASSAYADGGNIFRHLHHDAVHWRR